MTTLPLTAEAFARGRTAVVIVAGYQVEVRIHDHPAPGESAYEWLGVVDRETGMAALPSQIRALQSDGDFRCRVHRAAHEIAALRR